VLPAGATGRRAPLSAAGRVFIVVGRTSAPGFAGDGGPATAAQVARPAGVAALPDGGFVFADEVNRRVRRVDRLGRIVTVAGNGRRGSTGDGGPATQASLRSPRGVALAPDGAVLVADPLANRVRRIASDGTIDTFAGDGDGGFGGDGGSAKAAEIVRPSAIAVTRQGSVLILDEGNGRVRAVGVDGRIDTLAGGGSQQPADGMQATAARLTPAGLAALPDGGFALSDPEHHRVWRVSAAGELTTLAGSGRGTDDFTVSVGDGGAATAALVDSPGALATLTDGSVLVADGGELRRVWPSGIITRVAGQLGSLGFSSAAEPIDHAGFGSFAALSQTRDGGLLIADPANNRVYFAVPAPGTPRLVVSPSSPWVDLEKPLRRVALGYLTSLRATIRLDLFGISRRLISVRARANPGRNRVEVSLPARTLVCRARLTTTSRDGQVAALVMTPFADPPSWLSIPARPPPLPLQGAGYVSYGGTNPGMTGEIDITRNGHGTLRPGRFRYGHPARQYHVRVDPLTMRRLRVLVSALRRRDLDNYAEARTRDGFDHRVSLHRGDTFAAFTPATYSEEVPGARCLSVRQFPYASSRQWRLMTFLKTLLGRELDALGIPLGQR
jgi:hypothetical protein